MTAYLQAILIFGILGWSPTTETMSGGREYTYPTGADVVGLFILLSCIIAIPACCVYRIIRHFVVSDSSVRQI